MLRSGAFRTALFAAAIASFSFSTAYPAIEVSGPQKHPSHPAQADVGMAKKGAPHRSACHGDSPPEWCRKDS